MSRYIDADKLPRHGNRGGLVHWKDIEEQPTADVVEVVRCKDCRHKYTIQAEIKFGKVTNRYYGCDHMNGGYKENNYCSKGERKDD